MMEINVPNLVRIKPKALNKIGKYLRESQCNKVAIFYSEGVKKLFHNTISISMDSSEIKIIKEEEVTSTDIEHIFQKSLELPSEVNAIVAVGGGKAIDFAKYISFVTKKPLITVPTIISNDGFCSPLSSLYIKGKRTTVSTMLPNSIIIDTEVLKNSPEHFIYSGMGDLFCKVTSVFDWKIAFKNAGTYVNDFSVVITNTAVDAFTNYSDMNIENIDFIKVIASSLMMTGIAIEIAGSSRPASGSEHLISHAYDKVAKKPLLHGLQVGVASYAVSYLQQDTFQTIKNVMIKSGFFDFMKTNKLDKNDFIDAVKYAPNIKENYYTILSEKGNIEKLVDFINTDEMINQMMY